jgi:2'-5' RNA ligase
MAETTRTFVALAVPEPLGASLVRLQQELRPQIPGCRWVSAAPFHATLAFLGDVHNRDLKEICGAVVAAARSFEPIQLELCGIGAFPHARKPRVIWAGLTAPDLKPLFELRAAVALAVSRAGYAPDDQRFHPHVTLGRMKTEGRSGPDFSELLARHGRWSAGTFSIRELITFASTLSPAGPSYVPLCHAPLEGKNSDVPP